MKSNRKYTGTDNLQSMQVAINYNTFLINLIKLYSNENDYILDFGAGIGTFAKELNNNNYNIKCLEPDFNQSTLIRKLNIEVYDDINSIPNNSQDFIYSLNVLEHIQDDLMILKTLKTKLKSNGKFLIYVPAFNILFSSMDKKVGHYRRYDIQRLTYLANKSGYIIEKIEFVDSIGFFASIVYKYFANKEGNINKNTIKIYDQYIFPLSRFFDNFFKKIFGKNIYIVLKKAPTKIDAFKETKNQIL